MRKWLLLLTTLCAAPLLWGQLSMVARVDKTNLTLDDELTLTVEVRGASGRLSPQLPSLPAFNVYSREINQSSFNGQSSYLFRYKLLPRPNIVGKVTIGPIQLNYQGKTYQTDPIEVNLYRSGTPSQPAAPATKTGRVQTNGNYDSSLSVPTVETADPSLPPLERKLANMAYKQGQTKNFFLLAAVSNEKPFVNETFTLAVRFYYGSSFDNAPYSKPSVSNLFIEDLGSTEGTQNINGRLFRYNEQRYQLAGAKAGEALIGSAAVEFTTGSSPFDLFDRMFGGMTLGTRERVESAPLRLNIRPLPLQGQPSDFSGAVGSGFVIAAKADPTTVEAGEAVNLTVTVQGPTNLKTSKDLQFPSITGFKSYPAASQLGTVKGNLNRTYKIFKTVLVPSASGVYTVPPISWSYFDPSAAAYKTIHTQPLTLTVTPSTHANRGVDFSDAAPQNNGVQTLGTDIHYLKTTQAPPPNFLVKISAWDWINWLVLSALAVCVFFASLGAKISAKKRAYSEAKSRLKRAASYEDIAEAVSAYLATRLHLSTGSMPLKEIAAALQARGYTLPTVNRFTQLWQTWEAARFAPVQTQEASVQEQAQKALALIKEWEEK